MPVLIGLLIFTGALDSPRPAVRHPLDCGLYCLYSIAQYYGQPASLSDLLFLRLKNSEENMQRTSTVFQLAEAARGLGFHVLPLQNLSARTVLHSKSPIILSVRHSVEQPSLDHYWVSLPRKGMESLIMDASTGTVILGSELNRGRWNGIGLVVSRIPVERLQFYPRNLLLIIGFCIVALVGRAALSRRERATEIPGHRSWSQMAAGLGVLIAGAFIGGIGYHCLIGQGSLINDAEMVEAVQLRNIQAIIPTVTDTQVLAAAADDSALFVDARLINDYNQGHLPGALSLSVEISDEERVKKLAGYSKDKPIIVYGQSSSCPYAFDAAKSLWRKGYRNLAYYQGGWFDWQGKNHG
ncbi:MAG: rhodanese-like domain-containing protein [Candidatus Hydrogenedentes bacterium]|nr:rhodanese-like domain-containing protein [Candidatus Hydrogenedentota bacterium]